MRITIRKAYHAFFGLSINILPHDSFVGKNELAMLCATPVVHSAIGLLARVRIGLLSSIVINVNGGHLSRTSKV